MEITNLQGTLALQHNQANVNNPEGEPTEVRTTETGRSAWKESALTLSVRDGKAAAESSPQLPPPLRDAQGSSGKAPGEKSLPPPLNDGRRVAGGRYATAKPLRGGVLRPVNGAVDSQDASRGASTTDARVDSQAKSEPVMRAIKEKVNNLFKVYPNGGTERHAEKVPSHAKSTPRMVLGAGTHKPAVSVDMYA
ncbi:MAG: hypothetical protein HQL64_16150 [Magnetococcales bacterium]|nr:hypothetical protein [Magnetococcales bacterium]